MTWRRFDRRLHGACAPPCGNDSNSAQCYVIPPSKRSVRNIKYTDYINNKILSYLSARLKLRRNDMSQQNVILQNIYKIKTFVNCVIMSSLPLSDTRAAVTGLNLPWFSSQCRECHNARAPRVRTRATRQGTLTWRLIQHCHAFRRYESSQG